MEAGRMPHNLDAEQGLLGAILRKNDAYFDVIEIVVKGDFFEAGNGEIFILLKDLLEAGKGVDAVTLMHDYSQDADIGGIPASQYLSHLVTNAPPPSRARELAMTIRDLALRRRGIEVGELMIRDFQTAPPSTRAEELRSKYDDAFATLFRNTRDLGIRQIGEISQSVIRRVDEAYRNERPLGLPIGIKGVQDLTGPLLGGRLYIIAGTPSAGKSILVQQIFENVTDPSNREPKRALLFEIEMEDEEIAERSLSNLTGIESERIEQGLINADEFARLAEASTSLSQRQFYVDGTTSPSLNLIRGKVMRQQRLTGLDVVGIDNLLYMAYPDHRMKEHEAIRANLQGLKRMAKDFDIPIIALAHLKKEYADDKVLRRPHPGDLYGGSALEQEADVLAFIYRPEQMLKRRKPSVAGSKEFEDWQMQSEAWAGKAEIILSKRRGGKGDGIRTIYFDKKAARFTDNQMRSLDPDLDRLF